VTVSVIRRAVLIFLPLAVAAAVVFYLLYREQTVASRSIARAGEETIVELARTVLTVELATIVSDVRFFAEARILQHWLASGDPTFLQDLAAQYLVLAKHKAVYDQIRFLDLGGREVVRVDWNGGAPRVVPAGELQDKVDRYYFHHTVELSQGEIYISPFDLNVERGVVERPIKPMIRFGSPVYDGKGDKRGVVVLNYLGQRLLDRVKGLAAGTTGSLWLLDADGYWLLGPSAEDEWGFMYPERRTRSFAQSYSEAWARIRDGGASAQFTIGGDLFTYAYARVPSFGPNAALAQAGVGPVAASPIWFVVAYLPAAALAKQTADLARDLAFALAAVLVLLAAVAYGIGHHGVRRQQAERQIQELNERLSRDNAELQALNKELEAFSYSVSHDLRAPLRAIDGFSQALLEDQAERLDEGGRDSLMRVRRAAQRMGLLIDDLLKLARIARAEVSVDDIDLSALAREIVEDLQAHAPQRRAEFVITSGLSARGDPQLLRVALENLLSNAWKFTAGREPARIEFGATVADGGPAYFVRDNGIGFDMAYAEKLFGAFQRLHDAKQFPGTGVGLATVQRIIHKHGGRVWAQAESNKGATFYFTL
jgi:signal transduction histidine kinase